MDSFIAQTSDITGQISWHNQYHQKYTGSAVFTIHLEIYYQLHWFFLIQTRYTVVILSGHNHLKGNFTLIILLFLILSYVWEYCMHLKANVQNVKYEK